MVQAAHAVALAGFRDEWLECRDGNHAWQRATYSFEQRDRLVYRVRHCDRCTAMQTARIVRHTGEYVGHPRIQYPIGYTVKGSGRIRKYEVRKEQIKRVYVTKARQAHEPVAANPRARKEAKA